MNSSAYLTRAGSVSIEIARRLLALEPGTRLATVADYAQELGTGVGTVQRAFKILEGEGAIRLEPRGRLGTYLAHVDRPTLWRASQQGLLIGLMPLPYTRRYEGLATGLRASLDALDVPFSIAFMSGASNRLKALQSGHHFAITSKLAAANASARGVRVSPRIDFGPGTFVEGHALVWAGKRRKRRPRVGIDLQSLDQVDLVRREFGAGADVIDVPYLQVLERLRAREFDVTVWATDALHEITDLLVTEFSSDDARAALPDNTSAVLVTSAADSAVSAFLRDELDVERLRQIQAEVLAGARVPRY
jgi:YhfZ C-terminal domain/Helix-turn-helix domain